MKPYQYDVFLSFTGADRDLKNQIGRYLKQLELSYYDSDLYCKGQFRPDFCQALDQSRVYLMILSDNLRKIPTEGSAQTLTEVRRECSLACELEARNELNIVILCLSEFFRFDRPFHDHSDQIGWFFYSSTRGFSQIRGIVDENGLLILPSLESVGAQCKSFVESRKAGKPVISQAPRYEIATEALVDRGLFVGRESMIEAAYDAYRAGDRAVILTGMGGIGKTTLAVEIARQCEEKEGLRCLQVVHINEVAQNGADASHPTDPNGKKSEHSRDAFRTVVSSVTYTKDVYDSLLTLAERDRYERKLSALRALPETVLLVIDNFNHITENDVRELLSKLQCRLLITTRSGMEEPIEGATALSVDSLSGDEAYEMFCRISGKECERKTFDGLYASVGGHTITLCIMAKMMAMHKMTIDSLIEQMGELETFDARVDFRHNEYGDSNTVLGHLETLFGISEFGENGCRILRSMSILANGTIPVDDLMEMLSLRNRNEILELTRSGWLELQTREENGMAREYLYLHPILSRLMAKQLTPTEENVGEMIAYLSRKCDEARSNMTYADATVLEDGLYYACYVIAGGSKRLSNALWTRFVEVNHLLGNVEETAKKTELLAARIADVDTRSVIFAYADMITLEQYPTRVEILEKYLVTLKHNARDYKWVMRSLSVTLAHINGVEKFRPFLLQALDSAIDAAMAQEDDFALLDLFVYYMIATKNMKALFRRMRAYIRAQRRKGKESGSLVYLDLLLGGSTAMAAKNASDYISKTIANLTALMNDQYGTTLKMVLLHPIALTKLSRWGKRITKLDQNDPMLLPLTVISGEVDRFATDGQFDAGALIEMTVHMYQTRLEQQTTLTSATDAVRGILQMLHAFPEDIVRRGTGELVDRVDMNHISIQSLSNLQVAMLINREFNNREAVTQAKQVIDVLHRLYPEGHSSILSATISYGDVCEAFGDTGDALRAYAEVFGQLQEKSPDSAELVKLAQKMLRLPETSFFSVEWLDGLYEIAQTDTEPLTSNHLYRMSNYLYRLFDKAKRGEIGYDDSAFDAVWSAFREICVAKNKIPRFTAIAFIRDLVCGASVFLTNQKEFDRALSMREFLEPFCKASRRELRSYAQIHIAHIEFYAAFHRGDEKTVEMGESVIAACIRKKILQRVASTDAMLMIAHLCNRVELPHKRLIKNPDALTMIEGYVQYFLSCCVKIQGLDSNEETAKKQMEEVGNAVLCDKLRRLSGELYLKDMNIAPKEYSKIRSADTFLETVFKNLMLSLIMTYRDDPIPITLRPPKAKSVPPMPKEILQPIVRGQAPSNMRWNLPYDEFRKDLAREWQPDQLEELREWLLRSFCLSWQEKPQERELPHDDPTGEWTDRARAIWKTMRAATEQSALETPPSALLFERDGKLIERLRGTLRSLELSEDMAEEIALYLITCGGVLPILPEAEIGEMGVDWSTLDALAEEQRYPRELFVLAGYGLCMGNANLREKPIGSVLEARDAMYEWINLTLRRIGYSWFNEVNPLDLYLSASFFVNSHM